MSKSRLIIGGELLITIALFVFGMFSVPFNLTGLHLEFIPGDLGDARFNNYILEHGYLWLTGDVPSYWNGPFMYPESNVILMSDNLLGTMPVYAVIRELGYDRETSFQYWIICILLLNFFICYWVTYKLTGNKIIAAFSAYIFAFSIYIFGQSNHAQVFPKFMFPLIIFWSYKYMSSLKIQYFLLLLTGTVFQIYCGIYLGLFSILGTMAFMISYLSIHRNTELIRQFKKKKVLIKHLGCVAFSFVMLAPVLLPYMSEVERSGYRDWNQVVESLPEIRSWFYSTEASKTWHFLSKHGEQHFTHYWNQQIFPGIIPVISFIVGIILLLSRKVNDQMLKIFIVSSLIIFVFTLNVGDYSLYWLIYHIPGFGALRSLDRIINLNIFFLAMIAAFLILEASKQKPKLKPLIWIMPFLIVTDNLVNSDKVIRFEKSYSKERVEYVKDVIRSQAGSYLGPVAYLPSARPDKHFEIHLDVMLACQDLKIPCVNGYSGSVPRGYNEFDLTITEEGLQSWLKSNNMTEADVAVIRENPY